MFVVAGLVREVRQDVFQLTMKGQEHLRMKTFLTQFEQVLMCRPDISVEDRTTWELMRELSNDGWDALPAPRQCPAAIKTSEEVPMEMRKYYFNGRKLTIDFDYLCCLASRPSLHKKGAHVLP